MTAPATRLDAAEPAPDWLLPVVGDPLPAVMRSPRHVDLAITGRCNLRCLTCYYADEMVARSDLPTAAWLDLLAELGRLRVMTVQLTGGEPLSHRDLAPIVAAVVANGMRFRVSSNGLLLTDEVARMLAASRRCDVVQISVDGSCAAVHDAIRGAGAFAGAVRAIGRLQAHGVPVTVRVTVNRRNVRDLPAIFRLLFEDLGLTSVTCNDAFPRGAAQCNLAELEMSSGERRLAEHLCLEAAQRYPRLSAQAGPLVNARRLQVVRTDLSRPPGERASGAGVLAACGIASHSLAVLHDGAIVPCHQLPHMVLGRVGVDAIATVWREAAGLAYLRARHRIPLGRLSECRDCRYQAYCTGGCPAVAYAVTGRMTARNPLDCLRVLLGEESPGGG